MLINLVPDKELCKIVNKSYSDADRLTTSTQKYDNLYSLNCYNRVM